MGACVFLVKLSQETTKSWQLLLGKHQPTLCGLSKSDWALRLVVSRHDFAVGLLVAATALPVEAGHHGSPNWYADDADHHYREISLTSATKTAVKHGVNQLDDYTDMDVDKVYTCGSSTDICIYDANYTSSWWNNKYGLAKCTNVESHSQRRCDKFKMYYDTGDLNGFSTTQRKIAGCHEFGHTVGLQHIDGEHGSTSSCMYRYMSNPNMGSSHSSTVRSHVNSKH